MNLIYGWVMQIIIFILMGTILELLIPNNTMKKYINIVIGLLLLVILSQPILYILSIDVTTEFEKVEQTILRDNNTFSETKNIMEKEKREIEHTKDAYIWNEVKLQLIQEADPILLERYSVQVHDIDQFVDNDDNLKGVLVTLTTKNEKTKERSVIKPIIIGTDEINEPPKHIKRVNDIKNTLEETWGLNKNKIQIMWEGGAS